MSKNPSAFPSTTAAGTTAFGMSLRDYFAAKAMQAVVTSEYEVYGATMNSLPRWAKESYAMADAMLEARK